MALKHALEMWTSKEEEKKRERGRVASKHGGGCGVRGESSGEVGKSVKRWTWEGELVTSSGVDFTAPVALILTSRPPLGKLRLSPPPQPPPRMRENFISLLKMSCRGQGGGGVSAFIWLKLMIKKKEGGGDREKVWDILWLGLESSSHETHTVYTVCFLSGIQINIPTPGEPSKAAKSSQVKILVWEIEAQEHWIWFGSKQQQERKKTKQKKNMEVQTNTATMQCSGPYLSLINCLMPIILL